MIDHCVVSGGFLDNKESKLGGGWGDVEALVDHIAHVLEAANPLSYLAIILCV